MPHSQHYYGPHYYLHMDRPYDFVSHNGMTFKKSVDNLGSRLARTVNFIRWCIVMNEDRSLPSRRDIQLMLQRKVGDEPIHRSWGSTFFCLALDCGFIKKIRKGNKIYYTLGPRSRLVSYGSWWK